MNANPTTRAAFVAAISKNSPLTLSLNAIDRTIQIEILCRLKTVPEYLECTPEWPSSNTLCELTEILSNAAGILHKDFMSEISRFANNRRVTISELDLVGHVLKLTRPFMLAADLTQDENVMKYVNDALENLDILAIQLLRRDVNHV